MSKIDQHLGKRVMQARELVRLKIEHAAELLDMSLEDYAALERGERRVGAFELSRLSGAFGQTISWFYEGLPGQSAFERRPKSSSI